MNQKSSWSSLLTLMSVFFFWGFVASSNSVLIPMFRRDFNLLQWQSQLVDFAFYIAYTFGSLVYFLISVYRGDPLNKIGYKKGLIIGLCISATGALGFIPAASLTSYPLMLISLFIVGLGFALLQIVANPYVIAMGNPATGSHRVSMAGGINSFGTAIGPLLMSFAIYGNLTQTGNVGISSVHIPYLVLCGLFLLVALILGASKLPPIIHAEKMEHDFGAFKYPQLILGMIAILVYVGVEVSIQSNMPELMRKPEILGLEHEQTVHFISLFWGSLMIGRWTGAITVFNPSRNMKNILTVVVPLVAYLVVLLVNYIKLHAAGEEEKMADLWNYFPFVFILIAGFFLVQEKPARTMMLFGTLAAIMMIVGICTTGKTALYAFISGGLFCSVMWPCIFSLSIAGLGKYTNQGSSLLIMMILGGAVIPPLQGLICDNDKFLGTQIFGMSWTHFSYIIPVLCFAYLAFYGWKVKQVLKKQSIDYDASLKTEVAKTEAAEQPGVA
jgi:FHS family L-fucose permease-like MFS transporter